MRKGSLLSLALLVWCVGLAFADSVPEVLSVEGGMIRGKTVAEGLRAFLGIPYAAPPVGDLRWKAPQPVSPWSEGRDCTLPGPSCPQLNPREGVVCSEDCLYLNVWTPASGEERLPVMVWIHGGAFNFGSGSQPEYDGANLARKGVVVVTLNYRLGPLGFFVHPLLAKESTAGVSGNYGLLDQIAALRWVQKNIAVFGGNPDQVTIFGQSAGSRSVSLQMISPMAAGLFHRAVAQSGGPIIGSEYLSPLFNGNMAQVSKMGERLSARLGCDKAEDELAALRARSAEDVVAAAACSTSVFDLTGLFFAPVFDGWVLPPNPRAAYAEGRQCDVPIIVGSTLNEGNLYLADEKELTLEKYRAFLKARFADKADEAFALFPAQDDAAVASVIDRFLTIAANAQPARFVARSMEQKKSPAFLYHFTRRPDTAMARKLGVHHGVDLAYVFGHTDEAEGYDAVDRELSRQMMAYWVNFAKKGDPNGPGLPIWPAYKSETDQNLQFGDALSTDEHLYEKECNFIDLKSIYK